MLMQNCSTQTYWALAKRPCYN